jgi:hypothetical protein
LQERQASKESVWGFTYMPIGLQKGIKH